MPREIRSRRDDPGIHRGSEVEPWKKEAACVDLPPTWWSTDDPRAKIICLTVCPVQAQCLDYVTNVIGRKVPGTWGGTTHEERNPLAHLDGRGKGGRFVKRTAE